MSDPGNDADADYDDDDVVVKNDTRLLHINVRTHDSISHSEYSESEVDFWNLYYSLGLIVFVVVLAGVIITAYFLWRTFERTPHVRERRASSGDSGGDDEDDEDDEGGVEVLGAEDLEEALKDDKSVLIGELEDLEGYLSEAEEELEEEDKRKRKKKKKDHGRHRKKKKKHRDVATGTDSDISYLKPKPKKKR